jgi:hypothetical protein
MRRKAEKPVSNAKLIPIPMYIYWGEVLGEINRRLVASYQYQGYIAEVYRGTKRNSEIEEVLDACISKVNGEFEKKGMRSKYPIIPRS